ncbi:MAG: hypothetical protein OXG34_05275 [bacterium]|nr:hypothetical protein [bacterium]MCY4135227.1 hypothetical protein [bacterium]
MSSALANKLTSIVDSTRLTHDDIGDIVDASGRSVSRWSAGVTEPQRLSRQRLLELAYVAQELEAVLEAEYANIWILSPNRLLDGDTPAERIHSGDFKSVAAVIEALADGVVV